MRLRYNISRLIRFSNHHKWKLQFLRKGGGTKEIGLCDSTHKRFLKLMSVGICLNYGWNQDQSQRSFTSYDGELEFFLYGHKHRRE